MRSNEMPVLDTHLHQRQAFNAMFMERLSLFELDPKAVSNVEAAIQNAFQLTKEIVSLLRQQTREVA